MTNESNRYRPGLEVAVIGMAARFPGAKNIEAFWQNLKNGVESISFFSDKELEDAGVDTELIKNPNYIKAKGFLEDIHSFDSSFFDYTPGEAEAMDPQSRVFHECAWEALEDAGYNPDSYPGLIGLYAGASPNFFWEALTVLKGKGESEAPESFSSSLLMDKDFLTTRVAYKLNLKGPNFTIYNACSTSLTAIHMACQAVLSGECDIALAGGVSITLPSKSGYPYQEDMIWSPDGHCRTFDARSNGSVFGNGVGIVVLKRLDEALVDNDNIYAVVKGSAVNNDGNRKVGYTAPGMDGQADVIRAALQMAEVEPESIGYIETHGTATPLGDSIEIEALIEAFNNNKTGLYPIGSVKTNIGHLDTAAGVAGFIKTVLALKHKKIPPSLHFQKPNPKIDFKNSAFYVNTELSPWKNDKYPLRAGVSAFGLGGTNAHVVLEEAPEINGEPPSQKQKLLLLSAKTESGLEKTSKNAAEYLKKNPEINLSDVSYTLKVGRKAFECRKMVLCETAARAIEDLSSSDSSNIYTCPANHQNRPVVFMFSGLGSQYVNMGLDLYRSEPVFREEMDRCFNILHPLVDYDIKEILYPPDHTVTSPHKLEGADVDQIEISQLLIFIFEYALARLLMKWGIPLYAMIGYSFGEYTAGCISGVFSLENALKLILFRGRLIRQLPPGAMLSVPLSETELIPFLNTDLSIAINNGESCIVAGPEASVEAFENQMKKKKYLCMPVPASHAMHSKMMAPVVSEFEDRIRREIPLNSPGIPFISNVTGTWINDVQASEPAYWATHLRETVRFADGIKNVNRELHPLFIEIGPGRDLTTLVARHIDDKSGLQVVSLVRNPKKNISDVDFLLNKIGHLWLQGIEIDWNRFYEREKRCRISLPTYPFKGENYKVEGDPLLMSEKRTQTLGKKPDIADWFYAPSWKRSVLPLYDDARTEDLKKSCFLIFSDDLGMGSRLAKRLKEDGRDIIMVRAGETFTAAQNHTFTVNPSCKEHYQTLFDGLRDTKKIPNHIIHMWGITPGHIGEPGIKDVHKAMESGFYNLLYLAKVLQQETDEIQITIISNQVHSVTGGEVICPEKATVLGPVKVIPQEIPNIRCRTIDMILPESWSSEQEALIEQLVEEVGIKSPDTVIAYRGNHRWVQTFEPVRLEMPKQGRNPLRKKGVYLITGGLGGIGSILAEHLAKNFNARLILTGRTTLPPGDRWEDWLANHGEKDVISQKIMEVKKLDGLGAEVLVFSADAANLRQMQKVVVEAEKKFGPINGVIHAAGIVGGDSFNLIYELDKKECETQLQPKVYGLLVLEKVLKEKKLDFCLLMSSLSSVLGGLGLCAYSAANLFMDAFAQKKENSRSGQWISVNWNDWKLEEEKYQLPSIKSSMNQLMMTPDEGVEAFQRVLNRGRSGQVVHSPGDIQIRLDQWIKIKSFKDKENPDKQNTSPTPRHKRPGLLTPYEAPGNPLEQTLVDIWEELFGIRPIGIHDDFFELGGDSLLGITLVNKLKSLLKEIVHITVIFDAPTIRTLADYFTEYYPAAAAGIMGDRPILEEVLIDEGINEEKISQARRMISTLAPFQESDTSKNPGALFILSSPRSGSTLLRVILGGHLKIFAPPELYLLSYNTLQERKASHSQQSDFHFQGPIRAIMEIKGCSVKEAERIMDECEERGMTSKQFYRLMQEWLGEKILVDKTPPYALDIETLKRAEVYFENPLYIHLLRHPYGMIRSFEEARLDLLMGREFEQKHPFTYRELGELSWVISNQNINEFLKQVPKNRKHRVLFEDLVKQPRTTMEDICQFIGLDFLPEMLEPYKEKKKRMTDGIHSEGMMIGDVNFHSHDRIDPEAADTWKKHHTLFSPGDAAQQLAKSFGYNIPLKKRYSAPESMEKKHYYPLSSAQKRLYVMQQMKSDNTVYNETTGVFMEGEPDRKRMEESFRDLIKRHENFRTSIKILGNEPVQKIHKPDEVKFELKYFKAVEKEAGEVIKNFVKPFDLSQAPFLRVGLAKMGHKRHLLVIDIHHIITDYISQNIFVREFIDRYEGKELLPLRIQYKDFSEWQSGWLKSSESQSQEEYWYNRFKDGVPLLNLPTDYPRPPVHNYDGDMVSFEMNKDLTNKIKKCVSKTKSTLHILLLSVCNILLSRYSGQQDIVVGSPIAGRTDADLQHTIGIFVNMLAMRNQPKENKTFAEFLQETKQNALNAYENQDYQFDELVSKLRLQRDSNRSALFDVVFHTLKLEDVETLKIKKIDDIYITPYKYPHSKIKYDLTFEAFDLSDMMMMLLRYSTELFKKSTVEKILNRYMDILKQVIEDINIKLKDIVVSHDLYAAKSNITQNDFEF